MSGILDRTKSAARKSAGGGSNASPHHPNHNPSGDRPTDLMINRGDQWRLTTKAVHDFFAAVATSEKHAASELTKAATALPLPFAHGGQFSQEEGGWQHTLIGMREQARKIAELHERFAKDIENNVLADLTRTKHTVKAHTKEIAADAGKLATETDAERKASTQALSRHGAAVGVVGQSHAAPTAYDDPYITSNVVDRQLAQQVDHENRLTKAQIHYQGISEQIEQRATREIQQAATHFRTAHEKALKGIEAEWIAIDKSLQAIDPAGEWSSFKNLKGAYVDPSQPLRDPALIHYPHQDHEATHSVWTGTLERKKRFAKSYVEVRAVITASGFMHTYPMKSDTDDPKKALPDLTLYLPNMSLGPQPAATANKHKIYIEGKRATKGGADSMMKKMTSIGKKGGESDHTFRASTHNEIVAVWEAIEPFTREVLSVKPSETKKSAVPSTVANIGYAEGQGPAENIKQTDEDPVLDNVAAKEDEIAAKNDDGTLAGTTATNRTAVVNDDEEGGGSSDEEEAFEQAPTTPGLTTEKGKEPALVGASSSAAPGAAAGQAEHLPGYEAGSAPPLTTEKKVGFAAEDGNASSSAAASTPAVHAGSSAVAHDAAGH